MNTKQETRANATTAVFGSEKMLTPAPTQNIPQHKTTPEIAYQMVKDETYPQTQPRLNLATFVTTYMDEYATRLMNEAINVNYIDETEYPRVAVMCGRCINIIANMWNSPEKAEWKTGALGIGSSEACMLGGVAAWRRWRARCICPGRKMAVACTQRRLQPFVCACAGSCPPCCRPLYRRAAGLCCRRRCCSGWGCAVWALWEP